MDVISWCIPQSNALSAGGQLRGGCVATAVAQTPIAMTERVLCYFHMQN